MWINALINPSHIQLLRLWIWQNFFYAKSLTYLSYPNEKVSRLDTTESWDNRNDFVDLKLRRVDTEDISAEKKCTEDRPLYLKLKAEPIDGRSFFFRESDVAGLPLSPAIFFFTWNRGCVRSAQPSICLAMHSHYGRNFRILSKNYEAFFKQDKYF